jgi:hypothetical protein
MDENEKSDKRKPSKAMVCKLMEVSGMRDIIKKNNRTYVENLSNTFLGSMDKDKKNELLERLISDEEYIKAFTKVYATYFTASEVMDLIAFHKTSVGQKLVIVQSELSPSLIQAIQALLEKTFVVITTNGIRAIIPDLDEHLKKFGLDHPSE